MNIIIMKVIGMDDKTYYISNLSKECCHNESMLFFILVKKLYAFNDLVYYGNDIGYQNIRIKIKEDLELSDFFEELEYARVLLHEIREKSIIKMYCFKI